MGKTLGDYIREAEAQRNLEKSSWYMPQYRIPISPPPYDPYLNYWDDSPPGFQNFQNQRGFTLQKSNLETLLENLVITQTKQNEEFKNQNGFLNDTLIKLTSKVDSISTHNKMLETQISQVAQQVASSSKTSGIFPGQPEQNPKAQLNAVSFRSEKKLEEPNETNEKNVIEEEALEKDEETLTEGSQIKIIAPTEGSYIEIKDDTDESGCEENEKDPMVHEFEEEEKVGASIFGQVVLTIGDAMIEVHKGKVTLRSGKEDDVIKALNSNENFSSLTSPYFDDVVETNISSELKMQDLLEKILILQDPSIVVGGDTVKIPQSFEFHPPHGKRKKFANHMVRKLRRCTALDVKFALGEPPD